MESISRWLFSMFKIHINSIKIMYCVEYYYGRWFYIFIWRGVQLRQRMINHKKRHGDPLYLITVSSRILLSTITTWNEPPLLPFFIPIHRLCFNRRIDFRRPITISVVKLVSNILKGIRRTSWSHEHDVNKTHFTEMSPACKSAPIDPSFFFQHP